MKILSNIIVNFHAIKDPDWFEKVLNLLSRLYNIVPFESIYEFYYCGKELKNSCHITFDDGDSSFYKIVFPFLKKKRIPASIFVSPKVIIEQTNFWFQEIHDYDNYILRKLINRNNKNKVIDDNISIYTFLKQLKLEEIWEIIDRYQFLTGTLSKPCLNMAFTQIKEIQNSGLVNIGAHTMNHPILKNESYEIVSYEITSSVEGLSNILGERVNSFAYPNGNPKLDFGHREIEILNSCGIKLGFTTELNSFSLFNNPLSIPRSGFENGSTSYILAKLFLWRRWDLIKKIAAKKSEIEYRI